MIRRKWGDMELNAHNIQREYYRGKSEMITGFAKEF